MFQFLYKAWIVGLFMASGCGSLLSAQAPVANFSTNATSGCGPLAVNFTNTSTNGQTYYWTFGDGNTSTQLNPVHLYATPGNYTVALVAVNGQQTDTLVASNLIMVHPSPTVSFSSLSSVCSGDSFSLAHTATGGSTYLWDLGDGTFSTDEFPTYAYDSAGSYTIALLVTSAAGCSQLATASAPVVVSAAPAVDLTVDTSFSCQANYGFQFNVSDSTLNSYQWHLGTTSQNGSSQWTQAFGSTGVYPVAVTGTNLAGCSRSDTLSVTIYPAFQPQTTVSDSAGCAPFTTTFQHPPVASVNFNFGDGTTGSAAEPTKTYTNPGSYTVVVALTDSNQCLAVDTLPFNLVAHTKPTAHFGLSNASGCSPLAVTFSDSSQLAMNHSWTFDTLGTATGLTPSFVFNTPGNHTVTLRVEGSNGCKDTLSIAGAVSVQSIQANFSTGQDTGCAPFQGTINALVNAPSYWWDLGNGQFSNQKHPVVQYANNGNYDVTMVVTSPLGCTDTLTQTAFFRLAAPSLQFSSLPDEVLCHPGNVGFDATVVGLGPWTWDFDDGDTSNAAQPVHHFQAPGTYHVQLQTSTAQGCALSIPYQTVVVSALEAKLNHSKIVCPNMLGVFSNQSPGAVSQIWEFGDGDTSSLPNPTHTYANAGIYTVKLKVSDSLGCTDETSLFPLFFPPCQTSTGPPSNGTSNITSLTNFVPQPLIGCGPFTMHFTNPVDTAISYRWYFGDGDSSSLAHTAHSYTSPGIYDVMLRHRNVLGQWDTLHWPQLIQISAPEAYYTLSTNPSCNGGWATFTDSSQRAVDHLWDFGNGLSDTIPNPIQSFGTGNFRVKLTVQDSLGCYDHFSRFVSVGTPNPSFYYPLEVCSNDSFGIQHNLIGYTTYNWDFGDGSFSNLPLPQHAFGMPGSFAITVSVTDSNGCAAQYSLPQPVVVHRPEANFSFTSATTGCDSIVVQLQNQSSLASQYLWAFGNGDTSLVHSPSATYTVPGSYDITLIATRNFCSDTVQLMDTVQVLTANALGIYLQNQDCLPIHAQFQSSASAGSSCWWDFGDSTTSNLPSPMHQYQGIPTTAPRFAVVDTNGCTDTVNLPPLNVFQAQANASAWSGCRPLPIQFSNSVATNLPQWWDYGNGMTSNTNNPMYTYQDTGSYTVRFATPSPAGCWDTVQLAAPVFVQGLEASFSETYVPGCAPLQVSFQSTSTKAVGFNWDLGNGTYSTQAQPQHLYATPGSYPVTLVATDSNGCSDTLTKPALIQVQGPLVQAQPSDTVGCHPLDVQFQNLSQNATSYDWYFGDGISSQQVAPLHQYQSPGTFTPHLVATDINGCSMVFSMSDIEVFSTPKADFSWTTDSTCLPVLLELRNASSQLDSASFRWDLGALGQFTCLDTTLLVDLAGTYALQLRVTNGRGGCRDSLSIPAAFQVFDTLALPVAEVLTVNVVDDSTVALLWDAASEPNFTDFQVWRTARSDSAFLPVFRSNDPFNTHLVSSGLDALQEVYEFRVSKSGECAPEPSLEALPIYNSVELSARADSNGWGLQWNSYSSSRIEGYELFRMAEGDPQFQSIALIDAHQNTFKESAVLCPGRYSYVLKVRNIGLQGYEAWSDTCQIRMIKNPFREQFATIRRSTVSRDSCVVTEWTPPVQLSAYVNAYHVYRSTNGGAFEFIAALPPSKLEFLDCEVDVHRNFYDYRIEINNPCDLPALVSNNGQSLHLKGEWVDEQVHLEWTPYEPWSGQVEGYRIEFLNEQGIWVPIDQAGPGELSIDIARP